MSRLSPFGFLFGKSLTDLVRGIRRYTDPEQRAEYLRSVVAECREEVRSANIDIKSQAVLKLAYLEMLGIDMSWAGFHVIEVMASPKFQQKRVGYMAATQCFRSDSELKMLVTNLLKMDLVNQNPATVGVALSGLASIVSPLLASDVADDIMRMLSHSKPYIRKKAVLALHNVVLQYPEALPQALTRFADLLDDSQHDLTDPGNVSVACATVSVICELATHADSVQDFLELTPSLYSLFTSSRHNWTLLKLLKIFQLFTKRERRLKSRLLPAVRDMMVTSDASSLIYESMKCMVLGNMIAEDDYDLAKEVMDRLTYLLETKDPNIAYLAVGLLGDLAAINRSFLAENVVYTMLKSSQPDPATRKRVLLLASSVVNDDNCSELVLELMRQFKHAPSYEYKQDIAHAISKLAAVDNYQYVPNFEWYTGVLGEIIQEIVDPELGSRLLDIVIRVKDSEVRESVSSLCLNWLRNNGSGDRQFCDTCWWIVGEYVCDELISSPLEFINLVSSSTAHISPVMITGVAKVVSKVSCSVHNDDEMQALLDAAIVALTGMSYSLEFEIQERACQFLEILKLAKSSPDQMESLLQTGLASLFQTDELGPIAPGSQQKITIPESLDIDTPIDVPSMTSQFELETDEEPSEAESLGEGEYLKEGGNGSYPIAEPDRELLEKQEAERRLYDLSRLSMNESIPKPAKKNVVIAADETVEGTQIDRKKSAPKQRESFSLPPVKVKHKKSKKKSAVSEPTVSEPTV